MAKLPKGFPRITVATIFDLIDWNGEGEEKIEIRPESENYTWFSIPSQERGLLSDSVLNRYVESLSANEDRVCIWLADKEETE